MTYLAKKLCDDQDRVKSAEPIAKVEFANTLRGFAAISVVFSHFFYMFWIFPQGVSALINSPTYSPSPASIYYSQWIGFVPYFSWGPFGVAIFFLISGFVIPFALRRAMWKEFMFNRIFRIYPTYIVGFSMSLFALYLAGKYFERPWIWSLGHVGVHYFPGIRDLFNVPMIDGIIWTLDIEMKFYVICALGLSWFRSRSTKVFTVPLVLLIATIILWPLLQSKAAWFDQTTVHYYQFAVRLMVDAQFIVYMFIGVAFNYMYMGSIRKYYGVALVASLMVAYYFMVAMGPDKLGVGLLSNYVFALIFFGFAFRFQRLFKGNKFFNFFADISYPLYVVHPIVGYVSLRVFIDLGVSTAFSLPLVTVSAISLAWLLHRAIERPSHQYAKSVFHSAVVL